MLRFLSQHFEEDSLGFPLEILLGFPTKKKISKSLLLRICYSQLTIFNSIIAKKHKGSE